jgi:hypothetical protein
MGLFDSTCVVTGLSLTPLRRIACVPVAPTENGRVRVRGPVALGPANRSGGIVADDAPESPCALVAGPVYDALTSGGTDLETALESLGVPLVESRSDGRQHTDGDVLRLHQCAARRFAGGPLATALAQYATLVEPEVAARLGSEAPPTGWLVDSAVSWYGAAIARERRASTSFEGLCADLEFLASFAFDPETLERTDTLCILVSQRGELTEIDAGPFILLENAGRRARLDDKAAATEVFSEYADEDPRLTIDREALAARVAELELPLAKDGRLVFVGSSQFERPSWVTDDSGIDLTLTTGRAYWTTAYGLTVFARVDAEGWKEPTPHS